MTRSRVFLKILNEVYTQYPPIKNGRVSGLTVSKNIPNTESIESSLENYEILKGIREVPFTDLQVSDHYNHQEQDKIKRLAEQIKQSQRIDPLIVVIDSKGPYILEGSHRSPALKLLGARSFPALVVIDRYDLSSEDEDDDDAQTRHERTGIDKEREQKNLKLWGEGVLSKAQKLSYAILENAMRKISSQRYLDPEIVDAKRKSKDYDVQYVILNIGGEKVAHIVNGHHSLEAARLDGVNPDYEHVDQVQQEADSMELDNYLSAHFIDSDWYDVDTGKLVF